MCLLAVAFQREAELSSLLKSLPVHGNLQNFLRRNYMYKRNNNCFISRQSSFSLRDFKTTFVVVVYGGVSLVGVVCVCVAVAAAVAAEERQQRCALETQHLFGCQKDRP